MSEQPERRGLPKANANPPEDMTHQIAELQEQLNSLSARIRQPDILPNPFIVSTGSGNTWQEICVAAGTSNAFTNGVRVCNDSANAAASITLAAGQSVMLQVRTATEHKFILVGGSGATTGTFPVIVKQNGVDGASQPLYDIYNQSDVTFTSPLNLAGALEPLDGRIRWQSSTPVAAAANGSVGQAYYNPANVIKLDTAKETLCTGGISAFDLAGTPGIGYVLTAATSGTDSSMSWVAPVAGTETKTTVASGSAVSLTTATVTNIGSITVAAGIWAITGQVDYVTTAASASDFKGGTTVTSATLGPQDTFVNTPLITTGLSDTLGQVLPMWTLDNRTVGGTTPVYLIGSASFSLGSIAAYGTIRALRIR